MPRINTWCRIRPAATFWSESDDPSQFERYVNQQRADRSEQLLPVCHGVVGHQPDLPSPVERPIDVRGQVVAAFAGLLPEPGNEGYDLATRAEPVEDDRVVRLYPRLEKRREIGGIAMSLVARQDVDRSPGPAKQQDCGGDRPARARQPPHSERVEHREWRHQRREIASHKLAAESRSHREEDEGGEHDEQDDQGYWSLRACLKNIVCGAGGITLALPLTHQGKGGDH